MNGTNETSIKSCGVQLPVDDWLAEGTFMSVALFIGVVVYAIARKYYMQQRALSSAESSSV